MAFLSNVMREIFAIITIPIVAKYVGYVECASLPGAAAMDTYLATMGMVMRSEEHTSELQSL